MGLGDEFAVLLWLLYVIFTKVQSSLSSIPEDLAYLRSLETNVP